MTSFESFAIAICVIIVAIGGVWCLYTLIKLPDNAIDAPNEAPYKIETPNENPPEDVAVPEFRDALTKQELKNIEFDTKAPPKRKYTKRSKYWTDKRKKAAAHKAKKKARKSK